MRLTTQHIALFCFEGNKLLQMKNKITLIITHEKKRRALLFKIMTIKSFINK